MKSIAFYLLALIATSSGSAAEDARRSMRPSLVALQVVDLEAATHWYISHLEFVLKDRKDFPEHGLKLALLERDDFTVELVENPKTVNKAQALAGKGTDITGFAKITFTVDDVTSWYEKLRARGASFAIDLRDSNTKPDEKFFVVLDAEKNWLQFVGKARR